jgi:flagellar biosynthesis/type III secretory pathway protein FliH
MPLIKSSNIPKQTTTFSMKDIEIQARSLLVRARAQSEQMLEDAEKQAEQLKRLAAEQGKKEGFAQGLAEGTQAGKKAGHDQALNEHRTQFTQLIQSINTALGSFEKQRQSLETQGVTDVVALAMSIARRVTKLQSTIDPEVLTANLHEAMKLVVHGADLRIAIHPSQKKTLTAELPNLQLQWPALAHAELIEDPALSPGGCRVLSRQGIIDADLDQQLDRVMANLLPEKKEKLATDWAQINTDKKN